MEQLWNAFDHWFSTLTLEGSPVVSSGGCGSALLAVRDWSGRALRT